VTVQGCQNKKNCSRVPTSKDTIAEEKKTDTQEYTGGTDDDNQVDVASVSSVESPDDDDASASPNEKQPHGSERSKDSSCREDTESCGHGRAGGLFSGIACASPGTRSSAGRDCPIREIGSILPLLCRTKLIGKDAAAFSTCIGIAVPFRVSVESTDRHSIESDSSVYGGQLSTTSAFALGSRVRENARVLAAHSTVARGGQCYWRDENVASQKPQ
jgi:hypothetical protein